MLNLDTTSQLFEVLHWLPIYDEQKWKALSTACANIHNNIFATQSGCSNLYLPSKGNLSEDGLRLNGFAAGSVLV